MKMGQFRKELPHFYLVYILLSQDNKEGYSVNVPQK